MNPLNSIIKLLCILLLVGCERSGAKRDSVEFIADSGKQKLIFNHLAKVVNNSIPERLFNDSLAFLILPVQASCPSCRKKTIDSIVKHQNQLVDKHFIVISANGGRKTINAYFREQDKELPIIENRLFLDTNNLALKYDLYYNKPTMYYIANRKAYKKVAAIPSTVREDLREFFSNGFKKE